MVPLAILSVELLEWYRGEFEHLSWQPLLYGLLIWGVVLPTIVLMEPETGAALRLPSLTSLWRNGAFFLQGLAFPLTMLSTPLEEVLSIDRYLLLMLVSLLGLFTAVAVYRWAKPAGLGLYALSWFAVGILPQWLMLDFAYVITSPRLLYLAAVGSALLWAGMPVLLWTRSAGRKLPKALAAIGVTGLLVFSVIYVRDKMALAETAASPLHQASDVASEWGNEASLLFVNVPAWIAPKDPTYRGGTEGLTFIPEYVGVRDFVYVNSGVDAAIKAVMFEPVKKDWEAYIGYAGQPLGQEEMIEEIRKADAVFLTTYDSGRLRFLEAGALELSGSVRSEALPLARFGREIMLLGRRVETFSTELRMSLWWQCQQVPEGDLTVFAHVYDRSGQLVAQMDGYPLAGLYTIQSCQPGDVIRDIRHIILPGDSSNRHYSVAVGWYDRVTGERLPVFDSRGRPVAHDAFVVHDHIPSQSDSLPPE